MTSDTSLRPVSPLRARMIEDMTVRAMLSEIAAGIQTEPRLTWVSTDFLKAQKVSPWRDLPVWIPGRATGPVSLGATSVAPWMPGSSSAPYRRRQPTPLPISKPCPRTARKS